MTTTKTEHTTGPWSDHLHFDRGGCVHVSAINWRSSRADDEFIRVMPRYIHDPEKGEITTAETVAECVANARLISAAPDLLAACQRAITFAIDASNGDTSGVMGIVKELGASIAKATT